MSNEKLLSALSESESAESATSLSSFDDERLTKIRKDFNELRFSKPQRKEIRKNLYDIKNPKNLSTELH